MRRDEETKDLLRIRDQVWKEMYKVYRCLSDMGDIWNDLVDRIEQRKELE